MIIPNELKLELRNKMLDNVEYSCEEPVSCCFDYDDKGWYIECTFITNAYNCSTEGDGYNTPHYTTPGFVDGTITDLDISYRDENDEPEPVEEQSQKDLYHYLQKELDKHLKHIA